MLEFDATLCIDLCVAQQLLQLYFHFQYSFAAGALRRVTLYAITQTVQATRSLAPNRKRQLRLSVSLRTAENLRKRKPPLL